jgi:hypothetical protein
MSKSILGSLALISLTVLASGCASASGQGAARRDIDRGHLELRGYGLPASWVPAYARLLKERLQVEYKQVAGCEVTDDLVNETDAYNAVMTAEIERRFGRDALTALRDEARSGRPPTQPSGA